MLTLTLAALFVTTDFQATQPTEITINDSGPSPENLTATKDGTVFFGSTAKGTIYRALPKQTKAEPWIVGSEAGLTNVLGVLADEKTKTLWVCSNAPFGRNATGVGQTALRSFDLRTGAPKGNYPTPGGGAFNDIAVSKDGTIFVSDTFDSRILRLKPGSAALDIWVNDPQIRGIDGLTFLADGALYFNNFFNGKLSRIQPKSDGAAGPIVDLETSLKFSRPDGLRTAGGMTMLQVEGTGRLTEITVDGDKASVKILKEGLSQACGVTHFGNDVLVLVDRAKAVLVPTSTSRH